ncbi:MAG TPA: hypothetical protein VF586_15655 [Pyrinomonadaceae bacterium]|jgi:hypothetical protein
MRRTNLIGRDHPLRHFFAGVVRRRFEEDLRVPDPRLAEYVSGLLVDFTHADSLYRVRDARGRRLEDVGEMLLESNPLLGADSFDREREVRKHVGDYVLFMTGLFPEGLSGRRRFGQVRLDAFVDYVRAGKESYGVVAAFDQFEYAGEAPLFRKLADNFELCVFGLNLVKEDLESRQRAYYRGLRETFGG